jgi:hypothetical protein
MRFVWWEGGLENSFFNDFQRVKKYYGIWTKEYWGFLTVFIFKKTLGKIDLDIKPFLSISTSLHVSLWIMPVHLS